jgi:hypothetical protein
MISRDVSLLDPNVNSHPASPTTLEPGKTTPNCTRSVWPVVQFVVDKVVALGTSTETTVAAVPAPWLEVDMPIRPASTPAHNARTIARI